MNLSEIKKMDRTSDEFAELFHTVNKMYFTFDNPDSFQKAARMLNLILHRGEEWMIEMLGKMADQMYQVVDKDVKAAHGQFNVAGKDYFFDLYQNKDALGSIHKMLRNTVLRTPARSD